MAIAGNAIKAPHCKVSNGTILFHWQTTSKDNCVSVAEAVSLLAKGEPAIVMPHEVRALEAAWNQR
jgi:hypothetical protein